MQPILEREQQGAQEDIADSENSSQLLRGVIPAAPPFPSSQGRFLQFSTLHCLCLNGVCSIAASLNMLALQCAHSHHTAASFVLPLQWGASRGRRRVGLTCNAARDTLQPQGIHGIHRACKTATVAFLTSIALCSSPASADVQVCTFWMAVVYETASEHITHMFLLMQADHMNAFSGGCTFLSMNDPLSPWLRSPTRSRKVNSI